MNRPAIACVMMLTALIAGCAPAPGLAVRCQAAVGRPMLVFDLFFGRAIPERGDLTDAEWRRFQDAVVTPNLPNGYTVFDASGAWMNPMTRKTIQETTKVLIAALPDDPGSQAAIDRIRSAYQTQFHQQLVGMTVQPGCGAF
jgi:hypothetical protein